jgi:diguanylate cyclase (GGDEF)-like protein/PAS domain S-box-containing protein
MVLSDKQNSIEETITSCEDRINKIGDSIALYKKTLRNNGGKSTLKKVDGLKQDAEKRSFTGKPPLLTSEGHSGSGEVKPSKKIPALEKKIAENSLFEGLLRDIIREFEFEIQSGSEEETAYKIVQENTPDSVVDLDMEGTVLSVNPSFTNTFGYRDWEILGKNFFDVVPEEYHSGLREGMLRAGGESFGQYHDTIDDIIVFRAFPKEGRTKSLEGLFNAYKKDGNLVLALLIRDLSYNRSLYEELKEAKDHYDALSETIGETIIRIDEEFTIIFVNSAVINTFGYRRNEIDGEHFCILFPPGVFESHEKTFKKYFIIDDRHRKELGLANTIELLGKSKNRGVFPMEMSFGNSKDYRGRTMTCILRDITQRKHTERKLKHLAYHDKLTGLGNRDLFNNDVKNMLISLKADSGMKAALMFLDLDGFKQVNDTLGHEAGDNLLIDTARRLRGSLRETDSVYRFGGDEFVVLLNRIHKRENAAGVAAKLLHAVREPYHLEGNEAATTVTVGVSIGIAIIPDDGEKTDIITKNADLAMYSAKEGGKNRFVFYTREMDQRALEKWEMEQGIKKGLANGEFFLHYQPLVDRDGTAKGAEALARWDYPEEGLVPPDKFIPVAEETGLIIPLGNWIMETACRKMRELNHSGHPDFFISLNLSVLQFEHPDFLTITGNILRRSGISPKNVRFEITETSIMKAPEEAIEKMEALKEAHPGATFAIDDFGAGYSSLRYLSRLPADIIKIDNSFVIHLFEMNNRKVVNAILNLAEGLDLEVIAEGVETKDQLEYFNDKGCDTFQGYYFSRPVPLEELKKLLVR